MNLNQYERRIHNFFSSMKKLFSPFRVLQNNLSPAFVYYSRKNRGLDKLFLFSFFAVPSARVAGARFFCFWAASSERVARFTLTGSTDPVSAFFKSRRRYNRADFLDAASRDFFHIVIIQRGIVFLKEPSYLTPCSR